MRQFFILTLFIFLISCGGDDSLDSQNSNSQNNSENNNGDSGSDNSSNSDWLYPKDEIFDGGPGKDGIPSLDSPNLVSSDDPGASYLNNSDLIIGVYKNGIAKAYPHKILDYHEIVNDEFGRAFVTISYCPLTGTAFGWESNSNNEFSEFGVSGLLYNANLILYDRNTDSNWSQLGMKCINGELIEDEPRLIHVVETTWGQWKAMYPDTSVLSDDTGFNRFYEVYPYGSYKVNHDYFIFPASPSNDALPNKERVFAIIDWFSEKSKVYQFNDFSGGNSFKDFYRGKQYLVVGDESTIQAFELGTGFDDVEFEYSYENSDVFFTDSLGNEWSVFGEAISGPNRGSKLNAARSVISYWFAIAAFYPNPTRYYSN